MVTMERYALYFIFCYNEGRKAFYMNIDLLLTQSGEAGLISSENLVKKASGIVLDTQTGIITIEFADSDYMDLNIPIEAEFFGALEFCGYMQVGAIKNGNIAQAYQVPFMFQDNPYRGEALKKSLRQESSLQAFNLFVTRCIAGQPAHRDDLGDETQMGCVLGAASPASLQFAPHLAKRHALEIGVRPGAAPVNAPRYGGPGLGSSGGGGYYVPPRKPDEKE